jgi:hypothetical protein
MALDPSIILGIKPGNFTPPQEMYAQKMQLDQNELANRLGGLKIKEFEQGQADQNQLRNVYSQFGADTAANTNALYRAGLGKEAGAYAKSQTEQQKAAADVDHTKIKAAKERFDLIGQQLGFVKDNPTMENAQAAIQNMVNAGIMPPEVAQQKLADFQKDPTPQGIQRLATMGFQGALEASKQLPTFQTRNTGGTTDTLSINPVTGKVMVANSVRNTQSPDSIASNATAQRGQNMTDARTREGQAMTLTKPFEITGEDGKPVLVQQDKQGNIKPVQGYTPKQGASKPLTDTQAKALQFGSRMQESEDIIGKLAAKGTEQPGLIKRGADVIGAGAAANWTQSAPQQQVEQAQRNFINAALRRESGAAIAESEFANARQQYFPQPGDSAAVIAQKATNRQQATRGILAEVPDSENRVAKVRATPAAPNIDALLDKYK